MTIEKTAIADLVIIKPTVFEDTRGYFFEAYNQAKFQENGINYPFIQDNQSFSTRGVIRGLHLQINPFAQAKLVRWIFRCKGRHDSDTKYATHSATKVATYSGAKYATLLLI